MGDAPSDDPDAMAASSVEPADVGETPTRIPRLLGRDLSKITEPDEAFKARIQKLVESLPYDPAMDEPVPSDDHAERRAVTYRQMWEASLNAGNVTDLAGWRLDRLAADQQGDALRAYVDAIGPSAKVRNLVLAGAVGPGKTSAAIAAGWAALERGLTVRYLRHSAYLTWLRPDGLPRGLEAWQIRRRFRDCDLLILDDLGAEMDRDKDGTQHARGETLNLIGDRTDTPGRATIVTTNQRSETLTLMFGDQLMSRLSKRGHVLTFTGPDRRGRLNW